MSGTYLCKNLGGKERRRVFTQGGILVGDYIAHDSTTIRNGCQWMAVVMVV